MPLTKVRACIPGTNIAFAIELGAGMTVDTVDTLAYCRDLGFAEIVTLEETIPQELCEPWCAEAARGFFSG